MNQVMMWTFVFAFVVLLNANIVSSNDLLKARLGWVEQQAQAQELFNTLNKELLASKTEQLSSGIRYIFFNNQPELMANFDAQLDATNDFSDKLDLVNNVTGTDLFAISGGNVSVQTESLQSFILEAVTNIFKKHIPNDQQREAALASVSEQLEKNIAEVAGSLEPVPLSALSASVNEQRLSRTRRDIGTVISNIFRSIIQVALNQVQILFDAFMQSLTTLVTNLYIGDQQTNLILSTVTTYANQIILQITQLLVNIQNWGDSIIKNLITQSSRRRRDISYLETDELSWDMAPEVHLMNCRSRRDILSTIVSGITGLFQLLLSAFNPLVSLLNTTSKNVFISFLSAQYTSVGKFVFYPVRLLFEVIIDTVLPCTTCASIV